MKEKARFAEEKKEYEQTDKYIQMQKDLEERDTDDDFRMDRDPKGFTLYMDVLETANLFSTHKPFLTKLVDSETTDQQFLLKVISTMSKGGDLSLVAKALQKLFELKEAKGDLGELLYAKAVLAGLCESDKKRIEGHCIESVDQVKEALELQTDDIKTVEQLELYVKASKRVANKVDQLD